MMIAPTLPAMVGYAQGRSEALKQSASLLSPSDEKRLKEVVNDFEALFLAQYLEKGLEGCDTLFGNATGADIYKSMYIDAISRQVGGGLGISQLIVDYLKERG
ncbi:MAG: Rod binding protein [Campylobacterales bacterium]